MSTKRGQPHSAQTLVSYRGNTYDLPPAHAGQLVRITHRLDAALNTAALAASTPAAPHRSKQRIPPGAAARAAADILRGATPTADPAPTTATVIDLNRYAQAAARRRTLP